VSQPDRQPKNIALAWTGASGIQYGIRLLECLLEAGCEAG
jgi:4-hydroxy-3-polyprenylbenzoate decarboxylase